MYIVTAAKLTIKYKEVSVKVTNNKEAVGFKIFFTFMNLNRGVTDRNLAKNDSLECNMLYTDIQKLIKSKNKFKLKKKVKNSIYI